MTTGTTGGTMAANGTTNGALGALPAGAAAALPAPAVLVVCGRALAASALRGEAGDLVDVLAVRPRDLTDPVGPAGWPGGRLLARFARYDRVLLLPDDAVTEPLLGMTQRARRLAFPDWLGAGHSLDDLVARGGPGVLRHWVGLAAAEVSR